MKKSTFLFWLMVFSQISFLTAQIPHTPGITCPIFAQAPHPLNLCQVKQGIAYPEEAHRAEIEGLVQVKVEVDAQGNYQGHEIVQSSHPILSEAVKPFMQFLEFSPAIREGKPIAGCLFLPFIFRIRNQKAQGNICPDTTSVEEKRIVSKRN